MNTLPIVEYLLLAELAIVLFLLSALKLDWRGIARTLAVLAVISLALAAVIAVVGHWQFDNTVGAFALNFLIMAVIAIVVGWVDVKKTLALTSAARAERMRVQALYVDSEY